MTLFDLDYVQQLVSYQATKKGWKKEALYCVKRARQELDELETAITSGDIFNIPLEAIDIFYFVVQAVEDTAPKASLNSAFELKYQQNWFNKKKTEDEKGNVVLK